MIHLEPIQFRTQTCERLTSGHDLIAGAGDRLSRQGAGCWVDLWHLPLLGLDTSVEQALRGLRPAEVARANKIRVPEPRARFILDHAWRNTVLSLYGGPDFGYTLRRGRLGKDWLWGENAPSVSFSRTGSRSIVAISNLDRIGVDIEDREQPRQWLSIAEVVDQRDWPAGCISSTDRAAWICRQFVIKEALLKGVGVGLRFPLHAIEVGFSAASTELYVKTTGPARSGTWRLISEMGRPYSLAVAIKAEQPPRSIAVSQYHCASMDTHGPIRAVSTTFSLY